MDVVTAKRSVDGVIKTLSGCRTQENFDLLWSRAEIMAGEFKELIEVRKTWLKVRFGYLRLYAVLTAKTDIVGKLVR